MINERFAKLSDATFLRRRKVQTELAEWVLVGPRCWERGVRRGVSAGQQSAPGHNAPPVPGEGAVFPVYAGVLAALRFVRAEWGLVRS